MLFSGKMMVVNVGLWMPSVGEECKYASAKFSLEEKP